jgi:glyoxalase family protein
MSRTLGIHHVTAIVGDAQRNLDFYAGVLGLRLVKRTVNFDDPGTYHFYFGDDRGTPGSIITFFPWPSTRRGRIGARQVGVTRFAIPPESIGWWLHRLIANGVSHEMPTRRGDEQVLAFTDPDGLLLELVAHPGSASRGAWEEGPVAPEHAIRGLHSVQLWVNSADGTAETLEAIGFRAAGERDGVARFAAGDEGPGTIVDVRALGGFPDGVNGVGTVHHVAFRVADDAAQLALREVASSRGLRPTAVLDRSYFHSVYFREPGGVLFEIATDGPGFAIDEPFDALGTTLRLPPQYEASRASIEASLPRVQPPRGAWSAQDSSMAFVERSE